MTRGYADRGGRAPWIDPLVVAAPDEHGGERVDIGDVDAPWGDVEGCRAAHQRLIDVASERSDLDVRAPSLLPAWTVGHVLNHLARNAEAMVRRIDAALQGQQVEQYEGGAAGRAATIEHGASRSAVVLLADVVDWSSQLDERFASLQHDDWARMVRTVGGAQHPIAELPFRRWREVEVHLVDLGRGFGVGQWSDEFVERVLPRLLRGLPQRADSRVLTAWLLGRGPAPDLPPWG